MSNVTDRLSGVSEGISYKAPCRVATTASITLSGLQTVDGIAVAGGDRVLVCNQADTKQNGIYSASTGVWKRTQDFDGNNDIVKGTQVFVTGGSIGPASYFVTASDPIVVGTSAITFEPVFAGASVELGSLNVTSHLRFNGIQLRKPLGADLLLGVDSTNGSDDVSGRDGRPVKTIPRAIDILLNETDLNGYDVNVVVAPNANAYTDPVVVDAPWVGRGVVILNGNTAAPSTCLIHTTSANCLTLSNGARLTLNGFKLVTGGASGDCINVEDAKLLINGIDFGTSVAQHVTVGDNGTIQPYADYFISGDPVGAHIHMPGVHSRYECGAIAIWTIGTRTWGAFFIGMRAFAHADFSLVGFLGPSAVGSRGVIHHMALLNLEQNPIDYLPGSLPLLIRKGGKVIAAPKQIAPGESMTVNITEGQLWVSDSAGNSAGISYPVAAVAVSIEWQTGLNAFSTTDLGAGSNTWYVQADGTFTSRFVAVIRLTVDPNTPTIVLGA